ncbi:sirohydrochlorin chelatase [Spiribacter halobius]|uniref:Cobalamin biosynthesis protein CbiX n=1 Tax=Sediminicurvatus halobius TaxID=2182432 RepID=A0A2U2N442_9GAMM|nr:CbiX/SirB N-terminal domain-containing protein [Spiribacter halobius]PWG63956.1 cobalamin biosynthesis protein CbiX [Spiribacter halobius]UEX76372.1 cobalamin biosynthesis protein CbiX [Spiribacter halobius]
MSRRRTFLVDNGSLRPAATLRLRELAAALSERCATPVEPVSLLHSNKVDAAELGGEPARTFGPAATRAAREGATEITVLPLFFGPSRALTAYLPERIEQLRQTYPQITVRVAKTLVDLTGPLDLRLATALRDAVLRTATGGEPPAVILVDHGSPVPEVTAVRNTLAGQLAALLDGQAERVAAASMERRDGDVYRFNEPLLEDLLDQAGFSEGEVVVAMQFLSPGRHAGPDGDVAEICRAAQARHPGLATRMTPLLGEFGAVLDILQDRLRQTLSDGDDLVRISGQGRG